MAEADAPIFMLASLDPSMLYVTVTGSVCGLVKVIFGAAVPWHTEVVPEIDAAGVGLTVTVVDTVGEVPQPVAETLTVATPVNVGDHVTVPVVPVPDTAFPDPVTDQTYAVALVAEVVKAVVGVP